MRSLLNNRVKLALLLIVLIGIGIRFINFKESIYFGYDEARDAYVSQAIYTQGELKLIGAPASAIAGIYHGPLYYYLVGPLFLASQGDPSFPAVVFRLVNAAGIGGVFAIGVLLFNPIVGLISAFIYALSFEQYLYAIYVGNPSLANLSWIVSFLGVGMVYKYPSRTSLGILLMLLGGALAAQFDIISSFLLLVVAVLLLLMRQRLPHLSVRKWAGILLVGLSPVYTYLVAEIKFKFMTTKAIWQVVTGDTSILPAGESVYSVFIANFLGLFRHNIWDFSLRDTTIGFLVLVTLLFLLAKSRRDVKYRYILVWMVSMSVLLLTGGYMPLYAYAGVGIGLIIGFSLLIYSVIQKNKWVGVLLMVLVASSNLSQVVSQSTKSLVVEIKAQPGMKLADEIRLVNSTYNQAAGRGFTIRVTSMPYKVQTVWAYVYNQYGLKKYGYLPYLETGNVAGFPGYLPPPISGTTCTRYLIQEPVRGIPVHLINQDLSEENFFSRMISEEHFGDFVLQIRSSLDPKCHTLRPANS